VRSLTFLSSLVGRIAVAQPDSRFDRPAGKLLKQTPSCALTSNRSSTYPRGCSFKPILWLRTTTAKWYKQVKSAMVLIWKVFQVAEQTFRRLNAPELLPSMYAGMQYILWSWKYPVIQLKIAA
jgi:hypothetical protein